MTMQSEHRPLISIVTPAYDAAKVIGATIQSALDQDYGHFEMLVLDDGSTDNTASVVEEFAQLDPRIRLIRLPRNYGAPAGPRNIGVQQAKGEWIAFLDADDIWHPRKLSLQIEALEKTGAKFCSTQMLDFLDERDLSFPPIANITVDRISFVSQLISYQTPTSSVVVAAEIVRRVPFNEDLRYKAREDLDCWLKCHEILGESIKIRHPLLGYRISPTQISGKKLQMVKRHHFVLSQYAFEGGRPLGLGALVFTASHFAIALFNRLIPGRERL